MEIFRIGEKVINKRKITRILDEMLRLRSEGMSQVDVASRLSVDRTLVSRLESLGEIHKGKRIAIIGFPVRNKEEINKLTEQEGIDVVILMTEEERWNYIKNRSGLSLFNDIMEIISKVRACDTIIILGSDKRIKIMEAALGKDIIGFIIGDSPITEDKYVDIAKLANVIKAIKAVY